MIVELYGCPGCGKTYLVHKIIGLDSTVAMSDNKAKNMLIGAAKKASMLTPESMKLKRSILSTVDGENKEAIYIDRSVDCFVSNIVLLAFGYRHIKKDMFMAEGLIHRVVSMAVNFGLKDKAVDGILDALSATLQDVHPIYLKVEADICFKSAKKRGRHESEMDELPDDKLIQYIDDFQILFDHVTSKYGYTTITREDYSSLKELIK